ncbi:tetratricopeptide repeat protein [Dyadobacter chenwenxiniae]|uniref:Tetratricopeptide repeat protein n=1 Tax=Dyadobacter chenwenxiniae TaxID=2906456 RepID=A0A9X1PRL8_9BACT|nr:tetratricopeptide repeat protein [Dyadobacter chenwenxiniae]MCF0065179.1 tetratricopeptide repeat protein [Dyadobacter chenwenxiniae]UON84552.1 tetratricopeptide repeat protein [Dyadobacter chenwenxiniae]
MKICRIALLSLLTTSLFAQTSKIDSLVNVLSQTKADTAKVNLMVDIATEYWASEPDKTLSYTQKALDLAKKIGYLRGEAKSYQGFGIYYWQKNDYTKSLASYEQSKKMYSDLKDQLGFGKAISNMGLVYGEQGNYDLALDNYQHALSIFQESGDERRVASVVNSIGNVYKNQKNFEEALRSYQQAMAIWTKVDDKKSAAGALINIASIYTKQKKFDAAITSANKALALFESFQDSNGQIICLNNTGEIYIQKHDYPQAQLRYERALKINETFQSKRLMVTSYNGLGQVYTGLHLAEKAIESFQKAKTLALNAGIRPALQHSYQGLATAFGEKRDYANAFHFQQLASSLKDSLFNAENSSKITNLRVHYESEKKQHEIQLLQNEKDLGYAHRNMLALGLVCGLIVLGLAFNRQRLKVQKDHQIHIAQQALTQNELLNRQEREQQLISELEFRNKALTTHTLNLIQKNSILEDIRQTISLALKTRQSEEHNPLFSRLINLIDYSFNLDKDWDEFKMYFEGVHKDFFFKLKQQNPDLSSGELRLSALIRLNLNLKESATLLNIAPDSVKTARHRLRKKLNLPEDSNLTDYLMTI